MKLRQMNPLTALVDEGKVGHLLSRLGYMESGGVGVDIGRRLLGEADVLQFSRLAEDEGGVNLIAGTDLAKDPLIVGCNQERHGHARHEAGNVLVGNGDLMIA